MKTTNILIVAVIVAVVASAGFLYSMPSASSGEDGSFAQCLTDKGAIMYGTDWCSYCKKQRAMFGESFKDIDYRNCDIVGDECSQAGVRGFPTWVINGRSYVGVQSLEDIGKATGCEV